MSSVLANDLIEQISGDEAKKYFKTTFDDLQEKLLYNLIILGIHTVKHNGYIFLNIYEKSKKIPLWFNLQGSPISIYYVNFVTPSIPIKGFDNLEL